MKFDIISANPKIIESSLKSGLIYRAQQKGIIEIDVHDLRNYSAGKYKQIDDSPYGGGSGMILKPEPFFKCINHLLKQREYDEICYFSPQGIALEQRHLNYYSLKKNYILICGHYKGIDERVIDKFVTVEISIGDYVISCGDLAALVFIDATSRLIPGVLNDGESAITDSYQVETGFDYPQYTRPKTIDDMDVPEILLNGNHEEIRKWREEKAKIKFEKINSLKNKL
jgi:tRNA (guanine37-N1)-methyltransferase